MEMTAEEFAKLVDSKAGANLSFDEWLELDKEAHKLSHEEFTKFCEMGSGRIFGDRINLIKSIKADIDSTLLVDNWLHLIVEEQLKENAENSFIEE